MVNEKGGLMTAAPHVGVCDMQVQYKVNDFSKATETVYTKSAEQVPMNSSPSRVRRCKMESVFRIDSTLSCSTSILGGLHEDACRRLTVVETVYEI